MRRLSHPGADGERGIALVAALWFSVAIAGIAASFSVLARGETMRNRNMIDAIRANAVLEAGLERAVIELTNPTVRPTTTGTRVLWAFDGVAVVINIGGESGKIDLNAADSKIIAAVVQELGGSRDLGDRVGDAVVDWRDDNSLRQGKGAEDRDYRAADRPGGAADAPFAAVDELRDVLPVDPELYARLRGLFTVATGKERPNLDLAPLLTRRAALSAGPAENKDTAEAGSSESGADVAAQDQGNGDDPSYTSDEMGQADPGGSGLGDDDASDPAAASLGSSDSSGSQRDRQRRSEGFNDPANLYSVRIDIRMVDGYEAHADALIWLQDGADGRPYRLLDWEPSPLRAPESP